MRLLFAGTAPVGIPVLEALTAAHSIVAVLTRPATPQGRSARLVPSPIARWGADAGIPVLTPTSPRDPGLLEQLRALAPEGSAVVAYGGLIPAPLLALPSHGWINLHFSLLPAYRGAAPVQRALLDGCTSTGVTTFRLVEALDAGPIFLQRSFAIADQQTAGDLLAALAILGAQVMVETFRIVEAGGEPSAQPGAGVSLAGKLRPKEARLDWTASGQAILNRVRAMSPAPGAWAVFHGERFKILRARLATAPNPAPRPLGGLWATKRALFARTIDGWLELIEVQAPGKRPMAGADWARGAGWEGARLD